MKRNYVSPEARAQKKAELIASVFLQAYPETFALLHREAPWPEIGSMAGEIENSFPQTFKEIEEEVAAEFQEWLFGAEGHSSFDEE